MNVTPYSAVAIAKPKHSMLPVLVVLFLISYAMLAVLVVEQSKTIDAQRYLIRELFGDSSELSAIKIHAQQQAKAKARAQAHAPAAPATPEKKADNDRTVKPKRSFEKPPKATSDAADARRSLMSI